MRFDTGGGYIRGVMAAMKPIANDAGIRDRRAKRELGATRGRTRQPTPLAWLQSATCNSEINSIGTALHNVRGGRRYCGQQRHPPNFSSMDSAKFPLLLLSFKINPTMVGEIPRIFQVRGCLNGRR